jgi:hypothetical protein
MATVNVSHDTDRARRGLPPLSRQRISYDSKGRLAGDKPSAKQHKTEVSHANRRASVTPVARNSPSGVRARANAGIRGFSGESSKSEGSKRRLNLGNFAFNPKNPSGYQHVLMGEMVAAFVIIGIRAIADYVPSSDLRTGGTETPQKGASPVVLIVSTLSVYFVLSFMATRGGWPARIASAFGLLMIVALMINSAAELNQVAGWVESIGTNNASQPSQVSASPVINSGNGSTPNTPANPGNLPVTGPPLAG